jgi:hypothetical protein
MATHRDHARPGERKGSSDAIANPTSHWRSSRGLISRDTPLASFAAVLVPPWNRIGADRCPLARRHPAGCPRWPRPPEAGCGIVQCNTHVDVIEWRDAAFIGVEAGDDRLVAHSRRDGSVDPTSQPGV